MIQIYCIRCAELKSSEDAPAIFTTGFVYTKGVNYAMGVCASHETDDLMIQETLEMSSEGSYRPLHL